jgi:hypothetical protein
MMAVQSQAGEQGQHDNGWDLVRYPGEWDETPSDSRRFVLMYLILLAVR